MLYYDYINPLKMCFLNFLFKFFIGYASSFTGRFALTDTGTFGPFQVCEQHGYLRICHNSQKIDLEGMFIILQFTTLITSKNGK